jgi:glycosyltransferase involved in cell wall biosynthesis
MKKIWILAVGEPSPVDSNERLHRAGILATQLSQSADYKVTLFNSTFFHQAKKNRYNCTTVTDCNDSLKLVFLNGRTYRKNISISRVFSNQDNCLAFREISARLPAPDIILVAFPILGLALEAMRYANVRNIPWIIDIRDFWPDIFYQMLPSFLTPLLNLGFYRFNKNLKLLLNSADGIISPFSIGISWAKNRAAINSDQRLEVIPFTYEIASRGNQDKAQRSKITKLQSTLHQKIVITCSGTISEHANIEEILSIDQELQKLGFHNFHFIICGSGPSLDSLIKKNALQKSTHVHFLGWLDSASLKQIFSLSHFGILPYRAKHLVDGVPNKAIEYLCNNLPIITHTQMTAVSKLVLENELGIIYDLESLLDFGRMTTEYTYADNTILNYYNDHFSPAIFLDKHTQLINKLLR